MCIAPASGCTRTSHWDCLDHDFLTRATASPSDRSSPRPRRVTPGKREFAVTVIEALAEACGPDHAWEAGPADTVDGVPVGWVAEPGDAAAVAAVLYFTATEGLSVVASGAGTKLDWGIPPSHADVLLDVSRLTGLLDLEPGGLAATVGAGT